MIPYIIQLVSTLLLILMLPVARIVTRKITWKYSLMSSFSESRTKLMLKYLYLFINISAVIIFIIIWGVDPRNILLTLSSIFAVIGVALFAQWSILSNITSGIIIFFTMHMRIGDRIKIHDRDFPIEAVIEDIKVFNICLRSMEGEQIVYPNNLILQKGVTIYSQPNNNQ